jgi:hypothetical protein
MSIYDRQTFFRVSAVICRSYVATGHFVLCQRIHKCFYLPFLPSGRNNLDFFKRMPLIYYGMSRVSSMLLRSAQLRHSGLKKWICNTCVMRMKNLVELSEDRDVHYDDEILCHIKTLR